MEGSSSSRSNVDEVAVR